MLLHLRPPIGCVQMGIHWERQMLRPRTPPKKKIVCQCQLSGHNYHTHRIHT